MRTQADIIKDMQAEAQLRDRYNTVQNEGARDGFNPHENRLGKLSAELAEVQKAESPLATREGIQIQREWAAAQKWTANDLQAANKACLARGYSLAELQAAIKTL
jgi:hypothetical protein